MALDDQSGSVWAVAIVFLVLTWITVSLRIYVRAEQIGRFGLDDKLVIVAQIFFTVYVACQMGGAAYGTGRHLADLDYANAETALRFWFFCEIWYAIAGTFVKVAICLSLQRITAKFVHLVLIYGLMIWTITLGIAFLLGVIFQCKPTSDWWDLDPAHKNCLSNHVIQSLIYWISAMNVACDWSLGVFPFFIVKDLAIPLSQKIMVASILAFGAIGSTATVVRMAYIPSLGQTYLGWNGDFLYDTTPVAVWTTVEVGVGITAICLATLRPLISKVLSFVRPYEYTTNNYGYASRLSDDSRIHIPLGDSRSLTPGCASTLEAQSPQDESFAAATHFNQTRPLSSGGGTRYNPTKPLRAYNGHVAGMTRFNQTKPLSIHHGEVEFDYGKSSPPIDYSNSTHFNTTKALSNSSYGEPEDDYHNIGATIRRHGPT